MLAVTLAEALCAAVAVTLTMTFVFRLSVPFALPLWRHRLRQGPCLHHHDDPAVPRQSETFRQPSFCR